MSVPVSAVSAHKQETALGNRRDPFCFPARNLCQMQIGMRGEKLFFPAGSFTKSAEGIFRSYWEKVSANSGENVFAVTILVSA